MKSSGKNIELASFDSIFSTEETRQGGNQRIQQLPLSELVPFKDHPFRVVDDDRMKETVESIREYGVLVPIIVRPMDDGSYEIVSGHRRKRACELAEVEEIPAIVRDLDDDEATIIMVDSNLQRENILPSERAKAYQMKLEAIRRRAGRPAKEQVENASQIGTHLPRADEIVAQDAGTSRNQVQRFIRLNELSEPLRDKVDNGELGFTPAVELSFLKPQEQEWVERALDETQQTPSLSQAQRIKQESKEGTLTEDTVHKIISEEKKPLYNSVTLSHDTLKKYFPKSYTAKQMENVIIRLLDSWLKKRQQAQER
ncbi:MAG: ParB/RepB/Spo0J family partition protein [Clostridia bacterium]|nr:ParB/RepB/Spo0J family partition protein [Clostridia bacterium]